MIVTNLTELNIEVFELSEEGEDSKGVLGFFDKGQGETCQADFGTDIDGVAIVMRNGRLNLVVRGAIALDNGEIVLGGDGAIAGGVSGGDVGLP